jgi:hypothetical protein
MADVVPPEVLTTLAVIEQTDDADYVTKNEAAFNEVLSQYGLKREEAYRYSVSRAGALGPMQFTNRRGKGTYALVVRRCPEARLDPNFERGATNLLNSMKAAVCLFDIELAQMRPEIRMAYHDNMKVLGIFPVAAYNGGPRNVAKLYRVLDRMGIRLEDLRPPGEASLVEQVTCPCLWREDPTGVRPVTIPKYNNENRWYLQKYQSILGVFSCGLTSERILRCVRLVDGDPAGAGERLRSVPDSLQVRVAGQTKIGTGLDLLAVDQQLRQLDLRLPGDARVPQENPVDRVVAQEFARNRRQTCPHDAGPVLHPGFPDCPSDSGKVHD